MAADWMVIPRALSAGKKSVTVDPSSTSVPVSSEQYIYNGEQAVAAVNIKTVFWWREMDQNKGTVCVWLVKISEFLTSQSSCEATIIEHTLCGSCFTLSDSVLTYLLSISKPIRTASMCAIIPILRVLAVFASAAEATGLACRPRDAEKYLEVCRNG